MNRRLDRQSRLVLTLLVGLGATIAWTLQAPADVTNMGGTRDPVTGQWTGLASLGFVTVGNPGNPARPYDVFGSVGYTYQIGTYEVTAGQYAEFLNAVAATDPYSLYNPRMDTASYPLGCGIKRIDNGDGTYRYTVAPDWANRPVNYVSWPSAMRFVNWLTNGQPVGNEDAGTTESGSYAMTSLFPTQAVRLPGARYVLPTLDEWYKAAYYDPNMTGGPGYWDYPTRSNMVPSNVLSATGTNNANFENLRGGTLYTIGSPYYRTEVGAFAGSPGPWGTFDQAGNVYEWSEAQSPYSSNPYTLGGGWGSDPNYMNGAANWIQTWDTDDEVGFRVALVPEPATLGLLALAGAWVLGRRRPATGR